MLANKCCYSTEDQKKIKKNHVLQKMLLTGAMHVIQMTWDVFVY